MAPIKEGAIAVGSNDLGWREFSANALIFRENPQGSMLLVNGQKVQVTLHSSVTNNLNVD